jgi:hypothetical protein
MARTQTQREGKHSILTCSPGEHTMPPMKDTKLSEYFSRIGKKAAKARMKNLSPTERKRIAEKAARARWTQTKKGKG